MPRERLPTPSCSARFSTSNAASSPSGRSRESKLPEFDTLRDEARAIKDHTLTHLDLYLEAYERKVIESGGQVHFAPSAADARDIVLRLCQDAGARLVTKGKSMVSEEIGLNAHLEAAGIEVAETDLGEHIIQIRGEAPSHIIAPVIHLNKEEIAEDFARVASRPAARPRPSARVQDLVAEARAVLREKFLAADVGITGANLLIAETGSSVIVTNEGNGDLTQTLPRMHIVIASIEKIVPTLEDACTILRLLARSGTGQEITTYTSFATGPARAGDPDGPRLSRRAARQWPERNARAATSRTCCAASAAAPVSTIARSMAPSAAMLTARSIQGPWAPC